MSVVATVILPASESVRAVSVVVVDVHCVWLVQPECALVFVFVYANMLPQQIYIRYCKLLYVLVLVTNVNTELLLLSLKSFCYVYKVTPHSSLSDRELNAVRFPYAMPNI